MYCLPGGGVDTVKFNLHIIGRAKKGCEFNQKKCELKIFQILLFIYFSKYDFFLKYICKFSNFVTCIILLQTYIICSIFSMLVGFF
jgi:hypothetical protein